MDSTQETATRLKHLRRETAAWQLLASRRAPLILACLKALFEAKDASIPLEEAA